ncbi:AAR014Cp [Eremothecium gossypii ATCC 10895]|uniref:AAR014Cp n=1 Tax=Eremothecium gossypii (strain ATCC 10895 / CBS 109.51 / FGSC 9923 / NRRL Y-1056) TaxID=284811 RepID=Q75ER5_EREGS|nr:AAR014Cp [Eremothecium gossypii ATCC 10895]AAS50379.1 AAR014Cp [Eremothecium gossypii ATCC 10895]AEY94665.1 FAAR014Cp [Eremothecium gossypii FDAG1]
MAKKDKRQSPQTRVDDDGVLQIAPPRTVGNKEQLQRANYLLQLAALHTMQNKSDQWQALPRAYLGTLDLIQKKTKIALTPALKRTVCKGCRRLLVPYRTVTSRVQNESRLGRENPRGDVLVQTCLCGRAKRFPFGKDTSYKTYTERDGTLLDMSGT